MATYLSFESARLVIRPTNSEDAAFMVKLFNSPKWLKYIGDRKIYTEEAAREYVHHKMEAQFSRLGYANYTLIRKSDELRIGVCGLYDRPGFEGIELGFALLPEYEGQGFGTEAATEITRAGFENFNLELLKAITLPRNLPSQQLLRKIGFTEQGLTHVPNDKEEMLLFSLSRNDFFRRKPLHR